MVGKMKIKLTKKKEVFNHCSPYIIAEIGANHNGDMDLAKKMIDSAITCGCDAVKFQSWNNKSLISKTGYDQNTVFTDSKKKHFGSLEKMVDLLSLDQMTSIHHLKYAEGLQVCHLYVGLR